MPLYIKESEVAQLLTMSVALDAVEGMFKRWGQGKAVNHPRRRIRIPSGSFQIMEGADMEQGCGFKAYAAAGMRTNMLVNLYNSKTGELLALLESNFLGAIRTGAASGVATKYMARPDASTVGIIGAGKQGETQIAAVCAVRQIKHVKVFSRMPEHRDAFASKMQRQLGVPMQAVGSAKECVENSDIVITITSSRDPVFDGNWLAPGTHINAAGGNSWQRREIDETTISRSEYIVCDDVEDARLECGELMWAVERGSFRWEQARELRDVVAGNIKARPSPQAITLFESQGIALEDIAAAWSIYELAKQRGMGTPLPS